MMRIYLLTIAVALLCTSWAMPAHATLDLSSLKLLQVRLVLVRIVDLRC